MGEPLIELKGVSKSFGSNVILDKSTLQPGEALAIIGPFWYWSTILRIIAGLLAHDAGEVYARTAATRLIEDALTRLALAWCFSRQLYSTVNSRRKCWLFTLSTPTCRDRAFEIW